jgi:hypothetical protein
LSGSGKEAFKPTLILLSADSRHIGQLNNTKTVLKNTQEQDLQL